MRDMPKARLPAYAQNEASIQSETFCESAGMSAGVFMNKSMSKFAFGKVDFLFCKNLPHQTV